MSRHRMSTSEPVPWSVRTVIAAEGARRATSHLERVDQLRPRQHPGEAVLRGRPTRRCGSTSSTSANQARIRRSGSTPRPARRSTRDDIVKGYEIAKGEYVLVTDDELAGLQPRGAPTRSTSTSSSSSTRSTRSSSTAPTTSLPTKGGQALRAAGRGDGAGRTRSRIARFVMRSKQYVAALRPSDGRLMLSTMVYADEVNAGDRDPRVRRPRRHRASPTRSWRWPSSSSSRSPRRLRARHASTTPTARRCST